MGPSKPGRTPTRAHDRTRTGPSSPPASRPSPAAHPFRPRAVLPYHPCAVVGTRAIHQFRADSSHETPPCTSRGTGRGSERRGDEEVAPVGWEPGCVIHTFTGPSTQRPRWFRGPRRNRRGSHTTHQHHCAHREQEPPGHPIIGAGRCTSRRRTEPFDVILVFDTVSDLCSPS